MSFNLPSQTLLTRIQALTLKRPGFALCIWGEAGIGKTHLVQHILGDLHFLKFSFHATTPLAQLVLALPRQNKSLYYQQLLAALERGQELESNKVLDLVVAQLCALAPVVIFLEDIHEANPDQQKQIHALAEVIKGCKGVGLILTSRQHPELGLEALQIHALPKPQLGVLLEQKLGAPLPDAALEWFFARTGGHPLFALEFLRHTMQQGYLWNTDQVWQWRTPDASRLPVTVEVLIGQQLERVTQNQTVATALYAKTLLPRDCPSDVWQAVTALSETAFHNATLELTRAGMLNGLELSHPLFAELARQRIPTEQRRDLAQRALAIYGATAELPNLLLAAELAPEAELFYWQQAIDHATVQRNFALAARFTLAALALYPPDQGQELARGMAHAVVSQNLELATQLFLHLKTLESNDAFVYAQTLAQIGRLAEGLTILQKMPEAEQQTQPWLEQMVLVKSLGDDASGAVALWQQHPNLHTSHNHTMLIALGQSLMHTSYFDAAKQVLERALAVATDQIQIADTLVMRSRLLNYASIHTVQPDLQTALLHYQAQNNLGGMAAAHFRLGTLAYYAGQPRAALAAFEQSLRLYAQLGHVQYWVVNALYHATHTDLGEYSKAEAGLLETDAALARLTPGSLRIEVCNSLSFLYRHWQIPYAPTLAQKFAQQALDLAQNLGNRRLSCNSLYHLSKSQTQNSLPELGLQSAQACFELANQLEYRAMQDYSLHARFCALRALGQREAALTDLRLVESEMRRQEKLSDADYYRLELEMEQGNISNAKHYLERLKNADIVVFAQAALRRYPALADQPPAARPKSCLQLLGTVILDGKTLNGRKRKELLFLLAEARLSGRGELSKLELLDVLYPNENDSLAAGALRKTVHQIRSLLGQDSILTTTNGYALGELETDAEQFLQSGETSLWRGRYGEDLVIKCEEGVRDMLLEALYTQAKQIYTHHPTEAIRVLKIILESDPYHLEALRLWMQVLVENKNYKTLNRVYLDTKKRLSEIGEPSPEHWSEFLENGKNRLI